MPAQRRTIRPDRADRETTRFDRFDAHCIGSGRDDIQYVRHRSANKHLYGPISAKLCSIATFYRQSFISTHSCMAIGQPRLYMMQEEGPQSQHVNLRERH